MSEKENHPMEQTAATLRVMKQSVRTVYPPSSVVTAGNAPPPSELIHIEAYGTVPIVTAWHLSGTECASRPNHEHSPIRPGDSKSACLIPENFPISLHVDVPPGAFLAQTLGDELVVTITR